MWALSCGLGCQEEESTEAAEMVQRSNTVLTEDLSPAPGTNCGRLTTAVTPAPGDVAGSSALSRH